jgi:hypothetical protein
MVQINPSINTPIERPQYTPPSAVRSVKGVERDLVQISRKGMERSRELVDKASHRIARRDLVQENINQRRQVFERDTSFERQDQMRQQAIREDYHRDYVRDFLDMSRGEAGFKANARAFATGARVGGELLNLGRHVDVTA